MILDIPAFMAAYRAVRHASRSAANALCTAFSLPEPATLHESNFNNLSKFHPLYKVIGVEKKYFHS
jgi:hypothetical protein